MKAELMVQQQVDSVWQHMVGVICLNLTNRVQVKRVLPEFFKRWPTYSSLLHATRKQIEGVIAPLGMKKIRSEPLLEFSGLKVEKDVDLEDACEAIVFDFDSISIFISTPCGIDAALLALSFRPWQT